MDNFAILINTCDKFEDCWNPFFKLFSIYWPDYKGKIYLNTEYKNYSHADLNIISVKGCEIKQDAHKITWSECLKRALESIDNDIVLYMQEDYFLKDIVKNDIVDKYAKMINDHKDIDCIHLTDQAVIPEINSEEYDGLCSIALKQRYRVSCQAALWRKDVLLSHIRAFESAWQFEEFGSKRSSILKRKFYVVNNSWVKLNQFEIIPYIFTGIVQGRWYEEVVPLFKKHNIKIDYTIRGFVRNAPKRPLRLKLINKLKRIPVLFKNYIDNKELKRQINKK